MSINGGTKVKQLTLDHKPNNIKEFERAIKNGSKVYLDDNDDLDRDVSKIEFIKDKKMLEKIIEKKGKSEDDDEEKIFRVYPSNLSVMRTIGDIRAKKKEFGGIPFIGCDGIFDDLSNQEICSAVWKVIKNRASEKNYDIHELSMEACDIS